VEPRHRSIYPATLSLSLNLSLFLRYTDFRLFVLLVWLVLLVLILILIHLLYSPTRHISKTKPASSKTTSTQNTRITSTGAGLTTPGVGGGHPSILLVQMVQMEERESTVGIMSGVVEVREAEAGERAKTATSRLLTREVITVMVMDMATITDMAMVEARRDRACLWECRAWPA
jgi:hypothetical protein